MNKFLASIVSVVASLLLVGCYTGMGPADEAETPDSGSMQQEQDAGTPEVDSGMVHHPPHDAGTPATDTGTSPPVDTGTVCNAPQSICGTTCRNLQSDVANCGACGTACATGQSCVAGACRLVCPTGQTACGNTCRDTRIDTANCGMCGRICPAGNTCQAGTCRAPTLTCDPGITLCGATCRDTRVDTANCGACGRVCPAGNTCQAGTCTTPATGAHTLFIQNGSGVAPATVGALSVNPTCGRNFTMLAWGTHSMSSSAPGGVLNTEVGQGRTNVHFACGARELDLCALYRAGNRTGADLLGSDAVIRVDGIEYPANQAVISLDIYGSSPAFPICTMVVAITAAPGTTKPGSAL